MRKDNRGFSLVELLIAVAISGIILTALAALVVSAVRSYGTQTAQAQVITDADLSLKQIEQNVLEANEISIKKEGEDLTFYTKLVDKDSSALGSAGTQWGYWFDKSEGILWYTSSGDEKSELCDNVEDFSVKIDTSNIDMVDGLTIKKLPEKLQIVVSITLTRLGETRTVTRRFETRNPVGKSGTVKIGSTISEELSIGLETIRSLYVLSSSQYEDYFAHK